MAKKKFNSKTILKVILEKDGAQEIMVKHGVPCMSCPMAAFELDKLEIGEVCKMYNLPLKKILEEVNKL